jgi:hypothetical protein
MVPPVVTVELSTNVTGVVIRAGRTEVASVMNVTSSP